LNVTDLSVTVLCLPFIVAFTDNRAYFTYGYKEVSVELIIAKLTHHKLVHWERYCNEVPRSCICL